jgi:CO/xanthine dehydrogenase Mo-binding subunit
MASMNIIGTSVKRKEDYRFLVGGGQYTDDVAPHHATYAVFVRSPHAHAKIRGIKKDKATRCSRRARPATWATGSRS